MTLIEAYNKYNEMKAWYDARVGAFLQRIATIDAKIEALKKEAETAVGAKLAKVMKTINKWIEKITKVISDIQAFIAGFERMIEDWIKAKVAEITQKITDKLTAKLKLKAETAAASATGITLPPDEEAQSPVGPVDYSEFMPTLPTPPPDPPVPPVTVADLPGLTEKYTAPANAKTMDDVLYVKRVTLGKNYTLGQLWYGNSMLCWTCEDLDRDIVWDWRNRKLTGGERKVHGETAIPLGRYKVTFGPSGMGPKSTLKLSGSSLMKPWITDVHSMGADILANGEWGNVRMHSGNGPEHSKGCLLLGQKVSNYKPIMNSVISSSQITCDKVIPRIYDIYMMLKRQNRTLYIEYVRGEECNDLRKA